MPGYIIIGSGAAGVSAVEAIRSIDKQERIHLISAEEAGYYSRPGLAYLLTKEIPEKLLFPFSKRDFIRLDVDRITARAMSINPQDHLVTLDSGEEIPYRRLLLAVGATARQAKIPGFHSDGVVKLDNLEDAREIISRAKRGRPAVVVGGGITALEIVEGLRARGMKTHYLLRRDRYWSNVLDETESRIVEGRLRAHGVQIHYHTEVAEILSRRGQAVGVRTNTGDLIRTNLVAIAVGIRPQTELAESAQLAIDRGVLVNEYLQTSQEDIYAAGDVAQVYDPFSGKAILDSLWGPARGQGYIAGLNMAGKREAYIKGVPFNVTRLAGLTTTIIGNVRPGDGGDEDLAGIARGDSETWRQLPDAIAAQDDFEVNRLRVMIGDQTLLGAIVMGDQTLSQPLHRLIAHQADIRAIREDMLQPQAPIADLIAAYWSTWRESGAAAES